MLGSQNSSVFPSSRRVSNIPPFSRFSRGSGFHLTCFYGVRRFKLLLLHIKSYYLVLRKAKANSKDDTCQEQYFCHLASRYGIFRIDRNIWRFNDWKIIDFKKMQSSEFFTLEVFLLTDDNFLYLLFALCSL